MRRSVRQRKGLGARALKTDVGLRKSAARKSGPEIFRAASKNFRALCKKVLTFGGVFATIPHAETEYGRLAQLVAHPLDVREVTSSSLVSSTNKKPCNLNDYRVFVMSKNAKYPYSYPY